MIKYIRKFTQRCQCCNDYKMNAPFYEWHSEVTHRFIGVICRKCAVRELFGSKYKDNERYKEWVKKQNDLRKV